MAVIFDTPEPTFRHQLSPIYKGDRPSVPDELAQQIPYLHNLIRALGVPLHVCRVLRPIVLSAHWQNVQKLSVIKY